MCSSRAVLAILKCRGLYKHLYFLLSALEWHYLNRQLHRACTRLCCIPREIRSLAGICKLFMKYSVAFNFAEARGLQLNMKKAIIEVHVYDLQRSGGREFCKYSKLFPGWWNRESDCFKSLCWISLGWKFSLKPSKKRASLLLLFEVVSSSSHTRHNVLGWCVAWDFLTRWKQMMSCETLWELESHFRSPNKLPLPAPPFLPPSPQQVRGVFFFPSCPCLEQFSYARPQALLSASTTIADLP